MATDKNTHTIRCAGCKVILELVDAHTSDGYYWCDKCLFENAAAEDNDRKVRP